MLNNVSIIGRLTKPVELRYTPAGKAVASGTLAVQRSFKNANGEYDADFIQFTIWGKVAEVVANRTEKGGRFGGTGRIETGSFDGQDGKKVYTTKVVIETISMIDWADNGSQDNGQGGQAPQGHTQNHQNYQRVDSDPFSGQGPIEVSDDDLPF